MLGLRRHEVTIVEHHQDWLVVAEDVCRKIKIAGCSLLVEVQHVGSTAVPFLPAKPILDIAAGIKDLSLIPDLIGNLENIGYIYRGDSGDEGGNLFVLESSPNIRTVHLHVVEYEGSQWNNYILFRNQLRENPQIREQYTKLKKQLKDLYHNDRGAYTSGKNNFINRILDSSRISK